MATRGAQAHPYQLSCQGLVVETHIPIPSMTAERQEFEEWINNSDLLTLNECPSQEPEVVSSHEANPYQDTFVSAAWEGWKARGRLEDKEDREEAKRHLKRKARIEAQEAQEGASESSEAPLELTTAQEAPDSPVEAPEDSGRNL